MIPALTTQDVEPSQPSFGFVEEVAYVADQTLVGVDRLGPAAARRHGRADIGGRLLGLNEAEHHRCPIAALLPPPVSLDRPQLAVS